MKLLIWLVKLFKAIEPYSRPVTGYSSLDRAVRSGRISYQDHAQLTAPSTSHRRVFDYYLDFVGVTPEEAKEHGICTAVGHYSRLTIMTLGQTPTGIENWLHEYAPGAMTAQLAVVIKPNGFDTQGLEFFLARRTGSKLVSISINRHLAVGAW
jgi:hypothetical protein